MKHYFQAFLISLLIFPLSAQSFNIRGSGKVFSLDARTDTLLMLEGAVLSGADLILDNALKANRAEYDFSKVYDKSDVNAFDRFFMNSYSSSLDRAGDLMLVFAMASPCFLAAAEKDEWFTVGVMYAETLLIANGIKELKKLCVTRARPYMYYDPSTYPEDDLEDGDFANSFPSGHSTMAFAGATFASYTFSKYFPDSPYRYAVTGGSYALALTTAALRIKSGNHFMTDVLTGAVIGSATGFLVPWLHTFNTKNDLNLGLTGSGVFVKVKW
ncbi:MAG: phosphatase PAP2 family protein [Treponema sp.]|nr:phosphatase PAP2 family protein [Treponema sp.]MBR0487364.1 phosphatase PAP2 family protein [Treponema sp.]